VLGSHDLEDIINVIDGRVTIFDEIASATTPLRTYLGDQFRQLRGTPNFIDYLPGMLFPDASLAERLVLLSARLQALAKLR
jgi:hypothetical protein